MLIMKESSMNFLSEYLPEALKENETDKVLELLYDLIDRRGFAPPHFDSYNDFGREAQAVYDDIYSSN